MQGFAFYPAKKGRAEAFFAGSIQVTVFRVSSEEFQSARAEDDGLSHVEKIFQQKNTFAIEGYSPLLFYIV
jgi:hypothetical protein